MKNNVEIQRGSSLSPRSSHQHKPNAQQPGRMAKKDMSFMKMVASDEDFQREVYEHGQDNLLVGAPPPSASLFCVCLC